MLIASRLEPPPRLYTGGGNSRKVIIEHAPTGAQDAGNNDDGGSAGTDLQRCGRCGVATAGSKVACKEQRQLHKYQGHTKCLVPSKQRYACQHLAAKVKVHDRGLIGDAPSRSQTASVFAGPKSNNIPQRQQTPTSLYFALNILLHSAVDLMLRSLPKATRTRKRGVWKGSPLWPGVCHSLSSNRALLVRCAHNLRLHRRKIL